MAKNPVGRNATDGVWTVRKPAKNNYFTVGRNATDGVFTVRKSASANTHVMDHEVFAKAVKKADSKFREVEGRSRKGTVGGDDKRKYK